MEFKLFAIFFAALFLDGIFLPALFGFRESFLSLLVLITPILYLGSTNRSIVLGFIFALLSEFFRGLSFGSLAIPFLATIVVVFLIQRVLDIKYTHILTVLVSIVSIYIFSFFYRYGSINFEYFDTLTALTIGLEALIFIIVFRVIFNKDARKT